MHETTVKTFSFIHIFFFQKSSRVFMVGTALAGAMLLAVAMLGVQGPAPSFLSAAGMHMAQKRCRFVPTTI
jgi:hypothetical protein